jgi:putative tryptophan/tyrosine transport system permease protein
MFTTIFGSIEQGIIYAIMALGVYISFRVLDFPDLTVDGSFVTGAAVASTMITLGYNPYLATLLALVAGFVAGCITGLLHTKGKINPLLAGILMMIALYSINLRIMGLTSETSVGRPNIPLLNSESIFTIFHKFWEPLGIDNWLNHILGLLGFTFLPSTWGILVLMIIVTFVVKKLADWFLQTEIGLALRATGDNQRMIRSFSANTNWFIVLGLGISNALVAFAGALIAQYSMFSDIGMGIGMIIVGLASVIIGEAIFGTRSIIRTTMAVIAGAIIYRIILGLALRMEILDTGDMKLITAIIVILALILPKWIENRGEKRRKMKRHAERIAALQVATEREGDTIATTQSD